MAYVESGYQQSEIISGNIQSPVIWNQNLEELSTTTKLVLNYAPATGKFTLEPAN